MLVTKISQLTGEQNVMELNVTKSQLEAYYRGDGHVQNIFPHLSIDEREFLKTGITPEEWNKRFGK